MKPEHLEVKLEEQKFPINEMMASKSLLYILLPQLIIVNLQEKFDALERRKEELKRKLAVKIEVCHLTRNMLLAEIPLNCVILLSGPRKGD